MQELSKYLNWFTFSDKIEDKNITWKELYFTNNDIINQINFLISSDRLDDWTINDFKSILNQDFNSSIKNWFVLDDFKKIINLYFDKWYSTRWEFYSKFKIIFKKYFDKVANSNNSTIEDLKYYRNWNNICNDNLENKITIWDNEMSYDNHWWIRHWIPEYAKYNKVWDILITSSDWWVWSNRQFFNLPFELEIANWYDCNENNSTSIELYKIIRYKDFFNLLIKAKNDETCLNYYYDYCLSEISSEFYDISPWRWWWYKDYENDNTVPNRYHKSLDDIIDSIPEKIELINSIINLDIVTKYWWFEEYLLYLNIWVFDIIKDNITLKKILESSKIAE